MRDAGQFSVSFSNQGVKRSAGNLDANSTGVMFMSCKVSKGWPHDCVRWKHQHFQMGHNGTPATLMFFFWLGGFINRICDKSTKNKIGSFLQAFFLSVPSKDIKYDIVFGPSTIFAPETDPEKNFG